MNSGKVLQSADEIGTTAVLEHIARYRMSVFDAVRRVSALADWAGGRINGLLRTCSRESLIASAPLCPGTRYWYLPPAGAQRLGLPPDRSGPLGEPARLRAYALLRFCTLSTHPRHKLSTAELERSFPTLYRPGLPCGYYFDPAGGGRLGLLRVDLSGGGRWDRAVQSLRRDIQAHALNSGFRPFIASARFEITFLTVVPQKARRVRTALADLRDARRVPVEIVAMPELLPLLCGRHSKRKEAPSR